MRQVSPGDYSPGPVIDTPELLDAVLKNEDALYVDGRWYSLTSTTLLDLAAAMQVFAEGRHEFRRAWLRCGRGGVQ